MLDLPRDELVSFASAVTGRFRNPIKHQLLSIALNGMTKYRTRILPQLLAGKASACAPPRLTFAPAALIAFTGESGMVRAIQYRMTPTGYRAIKRCGPAIAMAR